MGQSELPSHVKIQQFRNKRKDTMWWKLDENTCAGMREGAVFATVTNLPNWSSMVDVFKGTRHKEKITGVKIEKATTTELVVALRKKTKYDSMLVERLNIRLFTVANFKKIWMTETYQYGMLRHEQQELAAKSTVASMEVDGEGEIKKNVDADGWMV